MNRYKIMFADGLEIEEYGTDKEDIRDFLFRSYRDREISYIIRL